MKPPQISVLMPAYNAERHIAEAIKSILNQTFTDFELIIVNDGSTDNTEKIILSFNDERIRYERNEVNSGIGFTRNKAVSLARGKYCAMLDSDDISLATRFQEQVIFLEKHQDYCLCGSWAYLIDGKGNRNGKIKFIDSSELIKISLLFTVPIVHSSVMIKRDILQRYKYNAQSSYAEDFDLWLRLSADGLRMANIPKFLIEYRWHETNISLDYEDKDLKKKYDLLKPYIENIIEKSLSEKDFDLHQASFRLYRLGNKKRQNTFYLQDEKQWLQFLLQKNKITNKYHNPDFEAFLWSRWIVCCIFTKNWKSIISLPVKYYNPVIILKTIKLIIYK